MFSSQLLEGRIGFVARTRLTRFLAIELACPLTRDAQMATLAHERHHAVKIARAPRVVSADTFAAITKQSVASPNPLAIG
jgi:hypothetical protein